VRIIVSCARKTIQIDGKNYPCRIGRGGSIAAKMGAEGDEKTPKGEYFVRFGLYRADRLPGPPPTKLTLRSLQKEDGWCDDPGHAAYNRFVRLPFNGSHEKLWREDGAYDVVLVISHNDSPPVPGLGSAVFIHIAQPDDRQTLGCVALAPDVMIRLLSSINPGAVLEIA